MGVAVLVGEGVEVDVAVGIGEGVSVAVASAWAMAGGCVAVSTIGIVSGLVLSGGSTGGIFSGGR